MSRKASEQLYTAARSLRPSRPAISYDSHLFPQHLNSYPCYPYSDSFSNHHSSSHSYPSHACLLLALQ